MSYEFYTNYLTNVAKTPKQSWKDDFQANVDFQFYNAPDVYTIGEELTFGSLTFSNIDVRINHIINSYTSTNKSGDFRKLIFKDNDKSIGHGYRYQFDGNIWIAIDYDLRKYESNAIIVRKCNHTLKWYNDEGKLIQEPCIIDYFAYKSSQNITENKYMTIPNNNRYILMQNNEFTTDLSYDMRFAFNRMVWKIVNWDEISEDGVIEITVEQIGIDYNKDDPTNDLAINIYPIPVYSLSILNNDIELASATTLQLITEVKVDGILDESISIEYSSSDEDIATVNSSGLVSGVSDGSCSISAYLSDNDTISDSIVCTITVAPSTNTIETILGDNELSVGSSDIFEIYKYINGVVQADTYSFTLNNALATIESNTGNVATLRASENVGTIILTATNNITSDIINKSIIIKTAW